jgi:hypothetical protein
MEWRRKRSVVFLAKRLVAEELQTIATHLELLITDGVTPPIESAERRMRFMPTSMWEANKQTLAAKNVMSDDDWLGTAALLHAVDSFRMVILEEPPGTQLSPQLQGRVREQRGLVGDTYETLRGRRLPWEESAG